MHFGLGDYIRMWKIRVTLFLRISKEAFLWKKKKYFKAFHAREELQRFPSPLPPISEAGLEHTALLTAPLSPAHPRYSVPGTRRGCARASPRPAQTTSATFHKHPHRRSLPPVRSHFPLGMTKLGAQPQSTTRYRNWLSSVETTQRLPSVTPAAFARWEKPRSSPGTCTCSRKGGGEGVGVVKPTLWRSVPERHPGQARRRRKWCDFATTSAGGTRNRGVAQGAGVPTLTRCRRGRRSRWCCRAGTRRIPPPGTRPRRRGCLRREQRAVRARGTGARRRGQGAAARGEPAGRRPALTGGDVGAADAGLALDPLEYGGHAVLLVQEAVETLPHRRGHGAGAAAPRRSPALPAAPPRHPAPGPVAPRPGAVASAREPSSAGCGPAPSPPLREMEVWGRAPPRRTRSPAALGGPGRRAGCGTGRGVRSPCPLAASRPPCPAGRGRFLILEGGQGPRSLQGWCALFKELDKTPVSKTARGGGHARSRLQLPTSTRMSHHLQNQRVIPYTVSKSQKQMVDIDVM